MERFNVGDEFVPQHLSFMRVQAFVAHDKTGQGWDFQTAEEAAEYLQDLYGYKMSAELLNQAVYVQTPLGDLYEIGHAFGEDYFW